MPLTVDEGDPQPLAPTVGLRVKLSLMMFLQYAVTCLCWVVLSVYLTRQLAFNGTQVGAIYGTAAIAAIFSPMIVGHIADRWVPTQYLLGGLHLAAAVVVFILTHLTGFVPFYACTLAYALIFSPTVALTNSLCFHQIPDAGKHFPLVRTFGTVGWLAASLFIGYFLNDMTAQPMRAAAILGAVTGIFCLTLPHTPPTGTSSDTIPFIKALAMLRNGTFALFVLVSFILAMATTSYFAFSAPFLKTGGIEQIAPVATVLTLGQVTEIILLPLLPLFLRLLGMKWTLVIGIAAWAVRYGAFCFGQPSALLFLGIALHGIGCNFFFITAYIYVNSTASRDMRASAQTLYQVVTSGLGMLTGNILFGGIVDYGTYDGVVHWTSVWASSMIAATISLVILAFFFHEHTRKQSK